MINLVNDNGDTKECPTGFSWTTLFFGFFVPLFRKSYKYAFLTLVISGFTGGLAWLVIPFLINKHHIQSCIEDGYRPKSEEDKQNIESLGIVIPGSASGTQIAA